MTSSGTATGANVDPRCPPCPPGLRPLRLRSDFGAGLANPSELGGFDESFDVCPSRASSSAIRTRAAQLRRQRIDQLVALREPLQQLLNQRRFRHGQIVNVADDKIKKLRRARGPDQLRLVKKRTEWGATRVARGDKQQLDNVRVLPGERTIDKKAQNRRRT